MWHAVGETSEPSSEPRVRGTKAARIIKHLISETRGHQVVPPECRGF
jgi:hypothetical protein